MKRLTKQKDDHDALVAELREQGIRYLASSQPDFSAPPQVSPNELIMRLVTHSDARLRMALVALVLVVLGIVNAANGKCQPLPVIGGVQLLK